MIKAKLLGKNSLDSLTVFFLELANSKRACGESESYQFHQIAHHQQLSPLPAFPLFQSK